MPKQRRIALRLSVIGRRRQWRMALDPQYCSFVHIDLLPIPACTRATRSRAYHVGKSPQEEQRSAWVRSSLDARRPLRHHTAFGVCRRQSWRTEGTTLLRLSQAHQPISFARSRRPESRVPVQPAKSIQREATRRSGNADKYREPVNEGHAGHRGLLRIAQTGARILPAGRCESESRQAESSISPLRRLPSRRLFGKTRKFLASPATTRDTSRLK
jgi:hypothetical protein